MADYFPTMADQGWPGYQSTRMGSVFACLPREDHSVKVQPKFFFSSKKAKNHSKWSFLFVFFSPQKFCAEFPEFSGKCMGLRGFFHFFFATPSPSPTAKMAPHGWMNERMSGVPSPPPCFSPLGWADFELKIVFRCRWQRTKILLAECHCGLPPSPLWLLCPQAFPATWASFLEWLARIAPPGWHSQGIG